MSATLEQARAIVRLHARSRVRVRCEDGHCVEGRLQPHLRELVNLPTFGPVFAVFAKDPDWRKYAESFKDDPDIYRRALRDFARPGNIYFKAAVADRIEEVAP